MAKKKSSKSKGQPAVAVPKKTQEASIARAVMPVVLGAIGFVLLIGYTSFVPLLWVPIAIGAFVGLIAENETASAVSGSLAGLLGATCSVAFFQTDAYVGYLRNLPQASIVDVTGTFWESFLLPMIQANPMNAMSAGPLLTVLVGTLMTGLIAFAVHRVTARATSKRVALAIGYAIVTLVAVSLAYTALTTTGDFVKSIRTEPVTGQYGYDGIIDIKAVYLMRSGMSYYDSLVRAVGGDARLIKEKGVVNNKYQGSWGRSPTRQREPGVFYLWLALGFRDMAGVLWGAVALCVGILYVSFWTLSKWLSSRALFVPIFAAPALLVPIVWHNLFQPDLWAALVLILSALFLIRGDALVAVGLGLVAALFREVFVLWLFMLLVVYGVAAIRERTRPRLIVVGACLAAILVFSGAYAVHYVKAAQYLSNQQTEETAGALTANISRPLSEKFTGPTAFMMMPYGAGTIPVWPLAVFGALGFLGLTKAGRYRRYAVSAYLLFWLAFYATIGSTSSYWGQDVMPLAVIGTGILLADAEDWTTRVGGFVRRTAGGTSK